MFIRDGVGATSNTHIAKLVLLNRLLIIRDSRDRMSVLMYETAPLPHLPQYLYWISESPTFCLWG